ncbi:hypothetical protein HAX54_003258, partial [Datura stramonium]|nr:hypothetical protein [Datura stramonium]
GVIGGVLEAVATVAVHNSEVTSEALRRVVGRCNISSYLVIRWNFESVQDHSIDHEWKNHRLYHNE